MNIEKENTFHRFTNNNHPSASNSTLNSSSSYQNYKSAQSGILPPLKETNKFSSWAEKSVLDQVDELIMLEGENGNVAKHSEIGRITKSKTKKDES